MSFSSSESPKSTARQRTLPGVRRPLEDVRVLAIEQFGAGPWATLQLADLGAEVIKIEDPSSGGDVGRYVPPYRAGEDSLYFETFNRGKRSVSLDLRTAARPRGVRGSRARVRRRLLEPARRPAGEAADHLRRTCGSSTRGSCAARCRASARPGRARAEPAYDYVLQALAGWMSLTGEPDGPPAKSGLSLVDFAGGYVSALALLAGVWRARRDGEGCDCDTSLFETALSLLTYVGTWAATKGHVTERRAESAHPSIVPFQAFQTADGWITVACAKQKFWVALCRALELRRRPALRGLRGPRRAPRGAAGHPAAALSRHDDRGGAGAARGRAVRSGQRRARRARGPAGRRARRDRRLRAPAARAGARRSRRPTGWARTIARRRGEARTPRRCCASCAATTARRSTGHVRRVPSVDRGSSIGEDRPGARPPHRPSRARAAPLHRARRHRDRHRRRDPAAAHRGGQRRQPGARRAGRARSTSSPSRAGRSRTRTASAMRTPTAFRCARQASLSIGWATATTC